MTAARRSEVSYSYQVPGRCRVITDPSYHACKLLDKEKPAAISAVIALRHYRRYSVRHVNTVCRNQIRCCQHKNLRSHVLAPVQLAAR